MKLKPKKKKFNLTSEMISLEYTEHSNISEQKFRKKENTPSDKTKLTLSVPRDFVKKFKSWCVQNDITMSEALIAAFPLLREKKDI